MDIVSIKVFDIGELSPTVKARMLDEYRELATDFDWWTYQYETLIEEVEQETGIKLSSESISFDGFYSQGDCARLKLWLYEDDVVNFIKYRKLSTKYTSVLERATLGDVELTQLIDVWGTHCNSGSSNGLDMHPIKPSTLLEYRLESLLRILETYFMEKVQQLYKALQEEYEYLTSDEAVEEMIDTMGHKFTENGVHISL
jgi:hypothetical protein